MNGTVSRRVFVGSVAAGLPVVVGAGVAAWPFTDLNGQSLTSARQQDGPVVAEVHRQLKDALAKMQNGASEGARQAATLMRVYASTVDDGQLRAVLAKANRQTLLYADADHEMMMRHVDRLGLRREVFPPHSIRRGPDREAAVNRLLKEGLSPLMRELADTLDGVADKMQVADRRGVRLQAVRFMQPIPENCPNCEQEKAQVEFARDAMEIICAVALVFPLLMELCIAAGATYATFYMALITCQLIVLLCHQWG